jgi:hypothetical protein
LNIDAAGHPNGTLIGGVGIGEAGTVMKVGQQYKYHEDASIQELANYIQSTYGEHYIGNDNIQAFDVWHALGSAETSHRDTAIKYLYRYGKKGGHNRKDLQKAFHYILMLMYYHDLREEGKWGK